VPFWFFSSGPLDDWSEDRDIPPTLQVQTLLDRVGALGHVTFGGRLAPDARGFPASAHRPTTHSRSSAGDAGVAIMNHAWHDAHKCPKSPLAARVRWHRAHQQQCRCRPMPKALAKLVKARGRDAVPRRSCRDDRHER
jgi:hypothetical protein